MKKKIKKPIGLYNIDFNCYMNSLIQCLFHMTKFSDYFINNNFSQKEQPISLELKNIFKKLKDKNYGKPFYLYTFKELMGEYDDSFLGSNGADAADLLSYIFSSLTEEQTNCLGPDISMMSQLDTSEKNAVFKECKDRVGDDTALIYIMNYIQIEYICFSQKIWNGNIRISKNHEPIYAFENKCFIEFDLEDLLEKEKELDLNEFFNYYFNKKLQVMNFVQNVIEMLNLIQKQIYIKHQII